MDIQPYLNNISERLVQANTRATIESTALENNRELLESLPNDFTVDVSWTGQVILFAYTTTPEHAKHLAAVARAALHQRVSTKGVQPSTGQMEYTVENEAIRITVTGGEIPVNCRLIEVPHIYKTFRMECAKEE